MWEKESRACTKNTGFSKGEKHYHDFFIHLFKILYFDGIEQGR